MNPRVSRSSALASKATGFPIAKFAAKLAVGYSLDELQNDITRKTPACFEPTIDYCVVKIPRFAFEKFPGADPTLTTQMKSVGETMAISRTFKETLQKALRGLETGHPGFGLDPRPRSSPSIRPARRTLPPPSRPQLRAPPPSAIAFRAGWSVADIHGLSIDPWFLENMRELVEFEQELAGSLLEEPIPPREGTRLRRRPDRPRGRHRRRSRQGAPRGARSSPSTSSSTPAPRSSRRPPRTTTRPTRTSRRSARRAPTRS